MTYDAFVSYSHAADGLLAPRVQSGLQRFAKGMFQRRAIRVFRDESSLSANPHLWSSITDALDASEWFVLLLSADAAKSPWVNDEVAYWLQHKDKDRILPVVTEGEFGPDILPPALTFDEEPRWVDLRFARTDEQLDLKNPRFSAAVADIASAIRGVPKDELESEEVKQHRRTVRTAWAAGVALAALSVVAAVFAIQSGQQRRLADARALVGSAVNVLDDDPELTVLLTLAAVNAAPGDDVLFHEARIALREAVGANLLQDRFFIDDADSVHVDMSDDGETLIVASESSVQLVSVTDGQVSAVLAEGAVYQFPAYSPDESMIVVTQLSPDFAVHVFDATNHDLIRTVTTEGNYTFAAPGFSFTPDGQYLQVLTTDSNGNGAIQFYDTTTWSMDYELTGLGSQAYGSLNGTGDEMLITGGGQDARIVSFPNFDTRATLPETAYGALSPDGSRTLVANPFLTGDFRPLLFEVDSGELIDRVGGVNHFPVAPIRFSPDGRSAYYSTRSVDVLIDATTGRVINRFPALLTSSAAFSGDGEMLVTSHPDGEIRMWDLSPRTASGVRLAPTGFTPNLVNSDRLIEGPNPAFWVLDDGDPTTRWLMVVDPESGGVLATLAIEQAVALPDGRFIVLPWGETQVGPLSVWDPRTDEITPIADCSIPAAEYDVSSPPTECDGEPYFSVLGVSEDGSEVFLSTSGGEGETQIVSVLDADTLEEVRSFETSAPIGEFRTITDDWILLPKASSFSVVDSHMGEILEELPERSWRGSAELSLDDSLLYLGDQLGRVAVVDTSTWMIVDEWQAHQGSNRGLALSPDGERLATTGDDDLLRIWDLTDNSLVDQVPMPFPADAMFLDADRLAVISSDDPRWFVVNLDPVDLLDQARSSVTRVLSAEECRLYGVKECPSG